MAKQIKEYNLNWIIKELGQSSVNLDLIYLWNELKSQNLELIRLLNEYSIRFV